MCIKWRQIIIILYIIKRFEKYYLFTPKRQATCGTRIKKIPSLSLSLSLSLLKTSRIESKK